MSNTGPFAETRIEKNKGAQVYFNPRPARLTVRTLMSVTAVASSVVGYGPTRTFRTTHDLIRETTFLIFRDDLDSSASAAHVADRKGSAIRCNHRTYQLVRSPVVLIGS